MKSPALLPDHLHAYLKCASDRDLFLDQEKNLSDMVDFIECAALDHGWSEKHKEYYQTVWTYLSQRFQQNRLDYLLVDRLKKIIQTRPSFFLPFLPNDRIILDTSVNALLWHEIPDVKDLSEEQFQVIRQYVEEGEPKHLHEKSKEEVQTLLVLISQFEMEHLQEILERHLVRYITKENALEKLIQAHQNSWQILLKGAAAFINEGKITSSGPGHLKLAIEHLNIKTQELLEELKGYITELSFKEAELVEYLPKIRALQAIDLTESKPMPNVPQEIAKKILKLTLDGNPWVKEEWLLQFVNLKTLSFRNNLQFSAWSVFAYLPYLEEIDLRGNRQIDENQRSMIELAAENALIIY